MATNLRSCFRCFGPGRPVIKKEEKVVGKKEMLDFHLSVLSSVLKGPSAAEGLGEIW